jgi:2-succinyl-5-enolpyruvyl-6-hydroxy-3-cyclohexene-1-carboxylate synthase
VYFCKPVLSVYQANINTIVSALYYKGLRHAVICPGSRNAPLIMAFARFGRIRCHSVPDERVAGFIALGIAKRTGEPAAVICTSGTAVLNLYPAVAEAFYMQVPVLVISADRPAEMLGRWDGQTIRQFEVFKLHALASFQTPETLDTNHAELITGIVDDFYRSAIGGVRGPAHLNVPLKEPLYEAARLEFEYPVIPLGLMKDSDPAEQTSAISAATSLPVATFDKSLKVMILLGADHPGEFSGDLLAISENRNAVVLSDIISNAHVYRNIANWEAVLLNAGEEQKRSLVPDLLITTGKMLLNKTVRQLFRKHPPARHWHVAENGFDADTFFTGPEIIQSAPHRFFGQLRQAVAEVSAEYFNDFRSLSLIQSERSGFLAHSPFNEFSAISQMLRQFPEKLNLHLANSMTVRYVAYLAELARPLWKMYSNRGVSGIDGCSSTAVGMSIVDNELNILITGDIAFYYDINALWQRNLPGNLKIILMNNFGGGIFRNIDGPAGLPELDPYIETPHHLKADRMASHFGIHYLSASGFNDLDASVKALLDSPGMALLEVITASETNSNIFKQYKSIVL